MRRRGRLTFLFRGLVIVALLLLSVGGAAEREIPDLSKRINDFTLDLLTHAVSGSEGNGILSPQGIFHGLAMSYVASGGDTREELAAAVHFPDDNDQLLKDLQALRKQILADRGTKVDMNLANSAWLDDTHVTFRKDYRRKLEGGFGASLNPVKFKDAAGVAAKINSWVSEETKGRITQVVSADDLKSRSVPALDVTDDPALVLVDAIYFKANWASRFKAAETAPKPFRLDPATTQDVPMMHQNELFNYSESDRFQFIDMPYVHGKYSMCVLLPKQVISVKQAVANLTAAEILDLRLKAFPHRVDVLLPKFEITRHLDLKDLLSDMGVKAAFDNRKADFHEMIDQPLDEYRIYLRRVYHDAWIRTDENGSEAAAATTTVGFGCSVSAPPAPAQFHADHPFLFFIVHNPSRSVLFAGWIAKPKDLAPAPVPGK